MTRIVAQLGRGHGGPDGWRGTPRRDGSPGRAPSESHGSANECVRVRACVRACVVCVCVCVCVCGRCGRDELRLIVDMGLWGGAALGLIQMVCVCARARVRELGCCRVRLTIGPFDHCSV